MILGVAGLCGWVFNVPALTTLRPTFAATKFNTAVLFLCLGTALWMAGDDRRQLSRRLLGLLVVIIAGLTIAEYAFNISLGIDQLFFRDARSSVGTYPGRMALATAVCLLLLGLAVLSLGVRRALALQRAIVVVCLALSLAALCGYLYGVKSLYSIRPFSSVAVYTAIGLMAACLAYFLARPDEGIVSVSASGSNAALLLRTLGPIVVVVPATLGWLILAGQRAHLYDSPFSIALLVLGNIACLTVLTMLIARRLHLSEREQQQAEEALKKSEEKFSTAFRESPMAFTLTSARDNRYLDVNETFERVTGWRRDEVIGRTPFEINLWPDPAHRVDLVKELLAGRAIRNREFHFRCKDGTQRVALGSAEAIEIGGELCVLSAAQDITDRKQAEQALLESEKRFRLVANAAPALIWMSGPDKLCTYFNQGWLDFTGRPLEAELGNGWTEGVHSEDLEKCLEIYAQAFDRRRPFTIEYRVRRYDGEYRWVLDTGVPRMNADGSFSGYIGSAIDVTERKLAEEALASVSGRLIEAEERERTRIARELHDDINQQLALVLIAVDQLKQNLPRSLAQLRSRVEELGNRTSEVSSSIQALSHRLHSSKLEYLGLVAAMQGFCREFSDQHQVEVKFSHERVPDSLPTEVSLCLFRVLQAALTNAVRHSGVKCFEARLYGTAGGIHLTVRDQGAGFDLEQVLSGRGIGLVSMRERVRLVNGTISIQSTLNGGTTIDVDVPLSTGKAKTQDASVA